MSLFCDVLGLLEPVVGESKLGEVYLTDSERRYVTLRPACGKSFLQIIFGFFSTVVGQVKNTQVVEERRVVCLGFGCVFEQTKGVEVSVFCTREVGLLRIAGCELGPQV